MFNANVVKVYFLQFLLMATMVWLRLDKKDCGYGK